MSTCRLSIAAAAAAAGLLSLLSGTALAQNCVGRPDFDACMGRINQSNMNRLQQSQNQLFDYYLRTNQDWLRTNYQSHLQSGGHMTFNQFAYWGMMTANGTNIEGGRRAQIGAYEGQKKAHETIAGAYDSANHAWKDRSDRETAAVEKYDRGAIRGTEMYNDPSSGRSVELPYAAQQQGPFNSGGQTYYQGQDGTYYQRQGNYWSPMTPVR